MGSSCSQFSLLLSWLVCKSLSREVLGAAIPVTTAMRLHQGTHWNFGTWASCQAKQADDQHSPPSTCGLPADENNKFPGKCLRECSTPRWKHWTWKCHTCQMLKRENNKKYKARFLKEPPQELLQLPGRNKTLHWWKRHKKVKTCREQCERRLIGSSD